MQPSHEPTLGGYIKPDTEEERLYGSYFLKESWQIDQFAPLMYGLTPERFKYLNERPAEAHASEDLNAVLAADKMIKDFLDDMGKLESYETPADNPYMTKWKFLRWASQHQFIYEDKFLNYLSTSEIEICFEFLSFHHDLLKYSPHSREYHVALYIKNVRELEHELGHSLPPNEIYHHPRMQNVLRIIKYYGGEYKKRTITESWLKELGTLPCGRPKKIQPQ